MSSADPLEGLPKPPSEEGHGRALARAVLSPRTQAALTLKAYERGIGDLDLLSLVEQLQEQIEAAGSGDLARADEMLVSQAHILDRLFNALLHDAADSKKATELSLYLKYALRAQTQCRATWEVLSTMKRPQSISFIGQNNVAGVQQVNNGSGTGRDLGAACERDENVKSKLLEIGNGERLDPRSTEAAVRTDPRMAAVASVNRTAND